MEQEEREPNLHIENLQEVVLGGLLSATRETLPVYMHEAIQFLSDEHMSGQYFTLWRVLNKYYPLSGGFPSAVVFDEMLQSSHSLTIQDKVKLSEVYKRLTLTTVSFAEFRIAISRLKERWRDTQYAELLSQAQKIHYGSIQVKGKVLSGFEDSVVHLRTKLVEVEKLSQDERAPEGDINVLAYEFAKSYVEIKEGKRKGILTGFTEFDELTKGLFPGELVLIVGYAGEGKSKVVYNVAYNACYLQAKNVLFGTNEATRDQVWRNMVTRHSYHSKFGLRRPLRYIDLKFGTLNEEEEKSLQLILTDMRKMESKMFIFQLPHKANIDYIAEVYYRQVRLYQPSLIVIDYLGLIAPSLRRQSHREELDDVVQRVKRLAVELNVPIISPWQVSREAWKEALKSGQYTRASLAETSASEKSSDIIFSILRKEDKMDRLKVQLLKNRDGQGNLTFELKTDYSTSYVGSMELHRDILEI